MTLRSAFCIILWLFPTAPALAGGLLGDSLSGLGNVIAPGSNIGKPLDDLNKTLKKADPVYGTIENGTSEAVRNATSEFLVETAGPVLASLILASRQDAINGGVSPIPPLIRNIMANFYGGDIASGVVYRVGNGGDLSLSSNAFRYGDALAITLGDVIVFRDQGTASDLSIWAHELLHIQQYRSWGVIDFAKRYVRDSNSVERPAYDAQAQYINWSQSHGMAVNASNAAAPPMMIPPPPQLSNICATPAGMCVVPGVGMIGQGCFCGLPAGNFINGQITNP